MSVSIKVAVRCRPFTIDDDLGVRLTQNGEEAGEVRSPMTMFALKISCCLVIHQIMYNKCGRIQLSVQTNILPHQKHKSQMCTVLVLGVAVDTSHDRKCYWYYFYF